MCDEDPDGNTHSLTAKDIVEIRTDWGMGVPLSTLAKQRGLTEKQLRQQLGVATAHTIPEPPADKRELIGPAEVAQMRERKRQLQALREIIADREGRRDGQ